MSMSQLSIEYSSLIKLCVPTMLSVLKDCFYSDASPVNTSLNLSEGQLGLFAQNILFEDLIDDITSLANNDPAAKSTNDSVWYVWEAYKGLKAIMYYRIANHLLDFENNCLMTQSSLASEYDNDNIKEYMKLQARRISEKAAIETTIEIHPAAKIGKRFVIDHGVGTKIAPQLSDFSTVIGETCIIGDDCTILNSVLLGAAVINEASSGDEGVAKGKRHPTLGNKVTVCAGARILGNITIGDNVTIGPCCVITTDIPSGYTVTIVNQLQYSRPTCEYGKRKHEVKPVIHGLTRDGDVLKLFGSNLRECSLSIVTYEEGQETNVKDVVIMEEEKSDNMISFTVKFEKNPTERYFSLKVATVSYEYILVTPQVLNH